jgi:hypothetical protein
MMPQLLPSGSEVRSEDQLPGNWELKNTCWVLSAERLRAAG